MAQIASIYLCALGSLRWSRGHNRNSEKAKVSLWIMCSAEEFGSTNIIYLIFGTEGWTQSFVDTNCHSTNELQLCFSQLIYFVKSLLPGVGMLGTRDVMMTLLRSLFSKDSSDSKREKQIKCIMVILLSICIAFYELAISVSFLSVPGGLVEKQKRQV